MTDCTPTDLAIVGWLFAGFILGVLSSMAAVFVGQWLKDVAREWDDRIPHRRGRWE